MKKNRAYIIIFQCFLCCMANVLNSQSVSFSKNKYALSKASGSGFYPSCIVDINNDGLDDVVRFSPKGIFLDFQQTNGIFNSRFFEQSFTILPDYSICAGDLNNDGYNDLVFGGNSNVSFLIYENDSKKFQVSNMTTSILCQRSTLFDIDKDGDLDAFICNDIGKSQVFKNDGMGNMTLDQSLLQTSPLAGNYSAIWVDYNNDSNTDLYITKCFAETQPGDPRRTNLLYKNNGNGTFTEVGAQAGVDDNAQSWTTAFEDFDNDGDMDAFVVNHDFKNRLFRNNGNGTFTDVIETSGIDPLDLGAYEVSTGDFNNDGFIDIVSDLKKQLYYGNGDLTFSGQNLPFNPYAIGDLNNDGHLDIMQLFDLWTNDGNSNHWVKFQLKGIESNKNGIGSKIKIVTNQSTQIRELRAGQSYSPMQTLDVHFGVGNALLIEKVIITWPSGQEIELLQLKVDSTYIIPEATCIINTDKVATDNNSTILCGNDIILLAPSNYQKYFWQDKSDLNFLKVRKSGTYSVIYENSENCRGFSSIIIRDGDDNLSTIYTQDGTSFCKGKSIELSTSNGEILTWSNGDNSTKIIVDSSGWYYLYKQSECKSQLLILDSINVKAIETVLPELDQISYDNDSIHISVRGQNCEWYENETSIFPIHTGCTWSQLEPDQEKTVFVSNSEIASYESFYCGEDVPGPLTINSSIVRKLFFNITQDIILNSVDIYTKNSSNTEKYFYLVSELGDTLFVKNYTVNIGKNTIDLNVNIPKGSYFLAADDIDLLIGVDFFEFPYSIQDIGFITGSSNGYSFYPFFYNWKVTKADVICPSPRISITISPSSVLEAENEIILSPNPASSVLHISNSRFIQSAAIYNSTGAFVKKLSGNVDQMDVDVSGFNAGMYILKLHIENTDLYKPFVVSHF